MKFNTDAMTPEERAQYEDLAKRFGTEEPDIDTDTGNNAGSTGEDNDIYKGLHPTVRAEMEAMHKTIEAMQDRELMEVAKRYTIIGKKPEELMPVLKGLKAAGGTAYDDMISVLDSAVQVVETSGAFSEIGKRGTATNGDDAWKKIETAASEIAKSKPSMLWANAIEEACLQHPELVEEYEKSRR